MQRYRPDLLISILLIAITLAVYWQVRHHEFVNLDDNHYVTENPAVRNGVTKEGLTWAFAYNDVSYWHPLTWLSHMVDAQLYGVDPEGHHFNSVLFHVANTILLFLILRQMTGALWRSAAVAALFALHPLNVESVAWVANRKSVLSTFFWFLTFVTYTHYARRPGAFRYFAVLLCFALGLLSKPMVVSLPFVLLLLDYWPLGRLRLGSSTDNMNVIINGTMANARFQQASASRLVLEKVPLFLLSAASIYISLRSSHSLGMLIPTENISLGLRIQNALASYITYILNMIRPQTLLHHPHNRHECSQKPEPSYNEIGSFPR